MLACFVLTGHLEGEMAWEGGGERGQCFCFHLKIGLFWYAGMILVGIMSACVVWCVMGSLHYYFNCKIMQRNYFLTLN